MTVTLNPTTQSSNLPPPPTVEELVNPTWEWWQDGMCQYSDLDFHPTIQRGQRLGEVTQQQTRVCASCPVAAYCAVDGLKHLYQHGSLHGVWGGVAAGQTSRVDSLRHRLAVVAGLPDDHYLAAKSTSIERRRREVGLAHQKGRTAEEIARGLNVSVMTVTRDLHALGRGAGDADCPLSPAPADPPPTP